MENAQVRGGYYSFALFLYGFLAVITLISVFNIINSIDMSVSARIREYGAMRAIGMSSSQMVRMVAAEAVSYVIWGILIGSTVGLFLNYKVFENLITVRWGNAMVLSRWCSCCDSYCRDPCRGSRCTWTCETDS